MEIDKELIKGRLKYYDKEVSNSHSIEFNFHE